MAASASSVLSVPCLPSFVSLSGGVRLFGLVCALSPFICLPSCVSLHLSPFMCLPEWWCPLAHCIVRAGNGNGIGSGNDIGRGIVAVAGGSNGSGSCGNGSGNGRLEW